MKMANTYNPYSDIQSVYNAKVGWNKATTDAERKKYNDIATAARKNLEAYGYGDIANQISASGADATAARKILEKYSPQTTAPASTSLSNSELITTNNNEVRNKINQAWGTVQSDRDKYYSEYDKVSDYVNKDVTQTDEYKSAFDNIMPEYNLKAMQGRDNALASGGSSNGGNIDSYAAANAMRQQAALTAKGQALAHQIGLDTYNARVGNARNILSDLGIYQKDSWNAMGDFIEQQQTEGQRLFENNLAENKTIAEVTGYVPNEWAIANNDTYKQFLNADGSFKTEMEDIDIQALINAAKARGDTKTANDLAVVRARKMLGNYGKFGKYINEGDVAFMDNQITEARRESEQNNATVLETLKSGSADTRYGVDANVKMNEANNANALSQIEANKNATLEINKAVQENEKKEDVYAIGSMDEAKLEEIGVDDYGKSAIMSVIDLANKADNAGLLTKAQIIECLVSNSKENATNKNQLEKVSKYLGLGVDWLENIEDVNPSDWSQGVKYKQ
jgi:hypothetical protein